MSVPNPVTWYVYSADRHLVATYSSQAAAAAHVASWPAQYISTNPPPPSGLELEAPTPDATSSVLS